jgi:hypothetical protein
MTSDDSASKADSTSKAASSDSSTKSGSDAPGNYSRGEGQKPVTTAYKENWNLIFGEKERAKPARAKTATKKAAKKKAAKAKVRRAQ